MQPLFTNTTMLTEDIYKKGIVENYRSSHRLLRAISTAYAMIMFIIGYLFMEEFNYTIGVPFLIFAALIFGWNAFGYKYATKKSFRKFAALHSSHYQVEMNYRFYDNRIEQETSKTELTVMYKDISTVDVMHSMILIVFNKQVIIIDKKSMEEDQCERLIDFLKDREIKVRRFKR